MYVDSEKSVICVREMNSCIVCALLLVQILDLYVVTTSM